MASALELLSRYAVALRAEAPWIALALALFGCARWSLGRSLGSRRSWSLATLAFIAAGVAWSLHLGWIADDAFISFRYARNWAEGAGPVFNPGERVEGYTNFLWMALLGAFARLGLSLPPASVALTLTCFALALWITASWSARLQAELEGAAAPAWRFPIAAGLLALNYTFASFGTSGLETLFAALLVLAAVERADRGAFAASGALAIGGTLAHPDHAIFYASIAALLVLERRFRALLLFGLPFAVLYVPYFAWRWSYYGDLFPNTYYVKNADLTYFSQGARYLALSGMSSGLWAALPLAAHALLRCRQLFIARFCLIALPAFLLYVAKIGGDFMLGRLLCCLLPFVYILAELGFRSLASGARSHESSRAFAQLGLAAFCTAVIPVRFIQKHEVFAHVADERTFYPIRSYVPFSLDSAYWDWAHAFNRTFQDLSRKPTLAMFSVGIMGYETGLPMVDNAGLNHREVAHWRPRHRGRPGHEKIISPGLLVRSEADFSDLAVYPQPYTPLGRVNVDGVRFHIVKYDRRLFAELELAGVEQPPLLQYLRDYEPPADRARLECDLWHMQQIYFRHNPASSLRAPLLRRVLAAHPAWADYEPFLLGDVSPEAASWRRTGGIDFEQLDPGSERGGSAFRDNPVAREAVGQPPLAGTRGRFINTYRDDEGDAATGELVSAPFLITGDLITIDVAGGHSLEGTYVELSVGARRRFHATGCNSGILGRRLWTTRGLRGQLAVLRIVDRRRRELGHIVVDELVQWMSPEQRRVDRAAEAARVRQSVHD